MSKQRKATTKRAPSSSVDPDRPAGWAMATIGDVCEVNPGRPSREELPDDASVSFVPMPAVDADLGAITKPQVRAAGEVRKGFTAFQNGDVIVAKITPSMENGKAAVANDLTNGRGFGSTEFHVLRPKDGIVPEYVLHFVRQKSFRAEAAMNMTGTAGQKRVPATFLREADIPVPPLAEQQRIADKLQAITHRIQSARERLQSVPLVLERLSLSSLTAGCTGVLTDEWRETHRGPTALATILSRIQRERTAALEKKRRRVHSRFLDPSLPDVADLPDLPDLPPKWAWTTVGFTAALIQYGSSARSAANAKEGIPNLGMQNIQAGRIDLHGLKYVEPDSEEVPALLLQPGDLLFNRTNSPELVGKSAVFTGGMKAIFASYLVRVQTHPELALPQFVCHWINSPWGRSWAKKVKSDGVSQSNINSTKLAEMPLPLPALEEQKAICAKLDRLMLLTDTIKKRVSTGTRQAEWLVQSSCAEAFAGRLVESEAIIAAREGRAFESGEQLLSRIQALPIVRPSRQAASRHRPDTVGVRTLSMKALSEIDRDTHLVTILNKVKKGLTPEDLLKASDLSVDDFYTQLKREVEAKRVKESRKDKTSVLLEAVR